MRGLLSLWIFGVGYLGNCELLIPCSLLVRLFFLRCAVRSSEHVEKGLLRCTQGVLPKGEFSNLISGAQAVVAVL